MRRLLQIWAALALLLAASAPALGQETGDVTGQYCVEQEVPAYQDSDCKEPPTADCPDTQYDDDRPRSEDEYCVDPSRNNQYQYQYGYCPPEEICTNADPDDAELQSAPAAGGGPPPGIQSLPPASVRNVVTTTAGRAVKEAPAASRALGEALGAARPAGEGGGAAFAAEPSPAPTAEPVPAAQSGSAPIAEPAAPSEQPEVASRATPEATLVMEETDPRGAPSGAAVPETGEEGTPPVVAARTTAEGTAEDRTEPEIEEPRNEDDIAAAKDADPAGRPPAAGDPEEYVTVSRLLERGGVPLFALGTGALLVGGGILARKVIG